MFNKLIPSLKAMNVDLSLVSVGRTPSYLNARGASDSPGTVGAGPRRAYGLPRCQLLREVLMSTAS